MQNNNHSQQEIQLSIEIDAVKQVRRLTEENSLLRQENTLLRQENSLLRQENSHLCQKIDQVQGVIDELINTVALQKEMIQQLRDEIARLNGRKPKPDIPPSQLEGNKGNSWRNRIKKQDKTQEKRSFPLVLAKSLENSRVSFECGSFSATTVPTIASLKISALVRPIIKLTKRKASKPGQPKGKPRKKKTALPIHNRPIIQPDIVPVGATFKGYKRYTVQDIKFEVHTTQYWLARWQLPDGSYIAGKLPNGILGHYGPELKAYVLHQYNANRVPEELLLKELHARGVLISKGQLCNLLTQNMDSFHEEVSELLPAGIEAENQIQVDDTSGRHQGQNQYTTIIGNAWFSYFATTDSKSRINFLKLLQVGKEEYLINEDTLEYLAEANVASYLPGYLGLSIGDKFTSLADWERFLQERNITKESEVRFATEAALYASVIMNGIPRDLGVHSDDAGQFDLFVHSLCWIHEERHYRKLIMTTEQAQADLERVKNQIWTIYRELKDFKNAPSKEVEQALEKQFDEIFQQVTSSPTLNHQLKKTYAKKAELLRVLKRPSTPLHNNSSETCARVAKIKLKVSGGTRSDLGKQARDTFLSLKQTCRKLGINFISFLQDRVRGLYEIPRLAEIIRQRSSEAMAPPLINSA